MITTFGILIAFAVGAAAGCAAAAIPWQIGSINRNVNHRRAS
jgi:hypothetical protein